jgi:hypothetical protein
MKFHSVDGENLPIFALLVSLEAPKTGNFAPAHRKSCVTKEKLKIFDFLRSTVWCVFPSIIDIGCRWEHT